MRFCIHVLTSPLKKPALDTVFQEREHTIQNSPRKTEWLIVGGHGECSKECRKHGPHWAGRTHSSLTLPFLWLQMPSVACSPGETCPFWNRQAQREVNGPSSRSAAFVSAWPREPYEQAACTLKGSSAPPWGVQTGCQAAQPECPLSRPLDGAQRLQWRTRSPVVPPPLHTQKNFIKKLTRFFIWL